MNKTTTKRLLDALLACRRIARYTAGLDFDAYERQEMVRDAVERRLGVIGDALNLADRADPTVRQRLPELGAIIGLRNRVIHGYDAADDEIVWDVVKTKLPRLEGDLAGLLAEGGHLPIELPPDA